MRRLLSTHRHSAALGIACGTAAASSWGGAGGANKGGGWADEGDIADGGSDFPPPPPSRSGAASGGGGGGGWGSSARPASAWGSAAAKSGGNGGVAAKGSSGGGGWGDDDEFGAYEATAKGKSRVTPTGNGGGWAREDDDLGAPAAATTAFPGSWGAKGKSAQSKSSWGDENDAAAVDEEVPPPPPPPRRSGWGVAPKTESSKSPGSIGQVDDGAKWGGGDSESAWNDGGVKNVTKEVPRAPAAPDDDELALDSQLRGNVADDEAVGTAAPQEQRVIDESTAEFLQPATEIDPEFQKMDMQELVNTTCAYLRATEIPKFVDRNEEALLFPALMSRIGECSVAQLLDIVDSHWARSTNARYGVAFKDLVRDRIISDAETLPVELIQRSIVVLGMSVGKRKRDLDLFQYLGRLLVREINAVKDPHMLVEVLTAFARARIVPPNSFLALMGRRFPVLNKRRPLGTLPSYRAFVNLYRMGHDQMNPFRFLADRVFAGIQENLTAERQRVREKMAALEAQGIDPLTGQPKASQAAPSEIPAPPSSEAAASPQSAPPKRPTVKRETLPPIPDALIYPTAGPAARRRFVAMTGLKPIMFTKLLLILARFGAPHQTYMRPIVKPVLIPVIRHLAPPSFSRLVRAVRMFVSTDKALIEEIIKRMVALGPEKVVVPDIFEVLRILAHPDTPAVDCEAFMKLCYDVFSDESRLRAREMINVASDLLLMSKKDEVAFPATDKLMELIEVFAGRMTFLLNLGVLSLAHAEMLEEVCAQLKVPDTTGNLQRLREARREVNQLGDDEYYERLDIDVREIFFKTQVINSHNTFGAFRPIPAQMLWDYKQMLTKMRMDDVVAAVFLFSQAFPGKMILPLRRVLSASIIAKISKSGEPVIEDGEYKIVRTEHVAMTAPEFKKFAAQLDQLPLKRVQRSPAVWEHVAEVASGLGLDDERSMALAKLEAAKQRAQLRSLRKTVDAAADVAQDRE